MKILFVLSGLLAFSAAEYCFNDVLAACKPAGGGELENCNAKYGDIFSFKHDIQSFTNKHITHSFQYLLMSTHFNNYEKNRKGFTKMFKTLSDTAWNDAIELIKYMSKRGVNMDFQFKIADDLVTPTPKDDTYELYEMESLSKALDIQKSLAVEAHRIHSLARGDGEVMSHMENTFVHKLRDTIRDISGHTNDLKQLINNNKKSALNVYLFDEYLSKMY